MKALKLLTITFLAFISASVFAQAPSLMTYQAVVRNAGNSILSNTPVALRFTITKNSNTVVYSETQSLTTNMNGLFTATVGSGTVVSGNISTIDWSSGDFTLKTEIDPDNGTNYTITYLQLMASVPYAFYAKNAGTASTSSNAWYITGNSGTTPGTNFIGTTDDKDVVFKRNNVTVGTLSATSVAFGANAFAHKVGNYNCVIGNDALANSQGGNYNCAFGYQAISTATYSNNNSAFGYRALQNGGGSSNCAFGSSSLISLTSGGGNSAFGGLALPSLTNGNSNVAVGNGALYYLTTGDNNIQIGSVNVSNPLKLTSGNNNILIGYDAVPPSATGSNQVRIGDTNITSASIQVPWTTPSDIRWKENIKSSSRTAKTN